MIGPFRGADLPPRVDHIDHVQEASCYRLLLHFKKACTPQAHITGCSWGAAGAPIQPTSLFPLPWQARPTQPPHTPAGQL